MQNPGEEIDADYWSLDDARATKGADEGIIIGEASLLK